MLKLPKNLRIAGFDIEVKEYDDLKSKSSNNFGRFCLVEQIIEVDISGPIFRVLETLIHEINHAIYYAYKIDDRDDEERCVSIFSTAWVQVYRDNPELLEFIKNTVNPNESRIKIIRKGKK